MSFAGIAPPNGRVAVVVSHPDDETLTAGGCLARLASEGCTVKCLFVTDGGVGLASVARGAIGKLGLLGEFVDGFRAGELSASRRLFDPIDAFLTSFVPAVVFTHDWTVAQHQDHIAVGELVARLAVRHRCSLLAVEPPEVSLDFRPNLVVDTSAHHAAKMEALSVYAQHQDGNGPRYMATEYAAVRDSSWALHCDAASFGEAFRVARGMWQ